MGFKEVIEKYGYPVVSKSVANCVRLAPTSIVRKERLCGTAMNGDRASKFNCRKWKYLLDAPFKISEQCCNIMKKNPGKKYENETGRKKILGTMTEESLLRETNWVRYGCNAFENKNNIASQPISFWTEQDILNYIKVYNLPYSSIYGELIEEWTNYKRKLNKLTGKLKFTGCQRTGCMFCMFGCHLEKSPNRFQQMKITHPKQYDFCIRDVEDNGLGLGKVLDFIGVDY